MGKLNILLVSGTHGNEINPPWFVKNFFESKFHLEFNNINLISITGNPEAIQFQQRYIDEDLNRAFKQDQLEIEPNNYEQNRAQFLIKEYGLEGDNPCSIAIDLHTTTASMGSSLVVYGRRSADLALAGLLQNHLGLPIYLHENDSAEEGFLVQQWPCGLVIEIGPVAQNLFDKDIVDRFDFVIKKCLYLLDKLKTKELIFPDQVKIHIHQYSIDYPRSNRSEIKALIHSKIINKNWMPIQKGDPLFVDYLGREYSYEGESGLAPVFINEAAYEEKGIAMSLTKIEILNLPKHGVNSLNKIIGRDQ
mgnify:CR=1 FL=1|tara:strand:- start:868 stop:1785 length:918 start_codon:yes stop_codon:yes gene_type:complete